MFDPKIPFIAVIVVGLVMGAVFSRIKTESAEVVDIPVQEAPSSIPEDDSIFLPPYDDFTVTQGLHGYSYGHKAVDIAAGKGARIKSPINGVVTARYTDKLGNPTLVIENSHYSVTLMHGKYSVSIGQEIKAGQVIGKESNLGYTTDMQGRSCAGRDCGYHTHLNVYQKHQKTNVNPLKLLGR